MADGSHESRPDPKRLNDFTFSASFSEHGDTKKCSANKSDDNKVKLSFYTELETGDSSEKRVARGVVASGSTAVVSSLERNSPNLGTDDGDDRKKRCFDRYDSSESSDSGVVVLSPTESSNSAFSGSDITEPGSPRSPESSCGATEDGAALRMPPWASEPAPAGPRRPSLAKRPPQAPHRRITEYFNHKMKPHNGLKRDSACNASVDSSKRKCLPKNGVTQDLEKYISYLSQTLSPRVMHDMDKQMSGASSEKRNSVTNGISDIDKMKTSESTKNATHKVSSNGFVEYGRPRNTGRAKTVHANVNGLKDGMKQNGSDATKEKKMNTSVNGLFDKKQSPHNGKLHPGPSANGIMNINKHNECLNKKVPISANDLVGIRIAPALSTNKEVSKIDIKVNGIVKTTTKLDSKMNGVTCGSNNLSLKPITPKSTPKKETQKKPPTPGRRTNRKSSACIANSKNLTWSKANNLKQQVQLQKQNCMNSLNNSPTKNTANDNTNSTPKINVPNGVRPVPMMNGNINNLNMSVPNLQSCHQINLSQNGTVNSTNLASFVTMPQNVMLTTLRIPQNGITAQTVNQHNNLNTFNRPNVSVTSPTKLNGQFVFPFVQNLNGHVVQIPNLMAKVAPNFVLPQSPQLTAQRTDHSIQTQQAAQILINGTLLKLASNTMTSNFTNLTKPVAPNVTIPGMNKTVAPGIPSVGMTVQSKSNFTVNISHPLLMSPPGFIVNSVPNISVKETWSTTTTQNVVTCSNSIVQHPPPISNSISNQTLNSSSIPIAPVKPPDKPNQGLDPPNTLNHAEMSSGIKTSKCDIPWLTKTVNNNNVLDPSKLVSRPFAQFCDLTEKLAEFAPTKMEVQMKKSVEEVSIRLDKTSEEIRRVEEVARREETIFTQITVLKDVSSNVHNTVIEANYSSPTNESSESGLGTDKSIDSPSDSQVSKECLEEDSSLSLSISVCSEDTQGSQKSPILKQPKTIRFPPRSAVKTESEPSTSSTETTSITVCLWEDCKSEFECDTDLLEHLQTVHVESQKGQENYVCLWAQCKVRGKPSCSRLWLERHALSHGGNKPFKCIVDGCGRRFSTQILLERHVNNHFNEQSPNSSNAKKTTDSGSKLIRRNGKKLRYRRQPWSARMFDFFDSGIMEGLSWRLIRSTRWRLGGRCPMQDQHKGRTLTLRTAVAAARYNAASGNREALVTYYPPHILEDEWVPEKDVRRIKTVDIAKLPTNTKVVLYDQFCSSYKTPDTTPYTPLAPSQTFTKPPQPYTKPPQPSTRASQPSTSSTPARVLPVRQCTSSRLLNNLIAKQKEKGQKQECRTPLVIIRENPKCEVSGAAKRKMGRRHGGNAFWPCGR